MYSRVENDDQCRHGRGMITRLVLLFEEGIQSLVCLLIYRKYGEHTIQGRTEICDSTSFGTRADYIQSLKLPNLKEGLLGQTGYKLKQSKDG